MAYRKKYLGFFLSWAGAVATVEAIDSTTGVNKLLLARVEGMAFVTKFDRQRRGR